jgi:hypothetical protein
VSAVRRLVLEMSVSLDGYVATRDVSKTLKTAGWAHTRIASGDLAEEVDRLKREPGKDLLAHGGARFAQALSRAASSMNTGSGSSRRRWARGCPCSASCPGPCTSTSSGPDRSPRAPSCTPIGAALDCRSSVAIIF